MDPVLQSFLSGAPVLIGHFATTIALLAAGVGVYMAITPHNELRLIRAGNLPAALSFAGMVVGLALPLSASMAASFTFLEVVVWGVFALIGQIAVFFAVDRVFGDLSRRIEAGEMAPAVVLVGTKLAVAIVGAAALSG
jgi:putative membrane protein